MKYLEGFAFTKNGYRNSEKNGKLNLRINKRYVWFIPDHLENKIEAGDIVLVEVKVYSKKTKKKIRRTIPVLAINIYESNKNERRRPVLKILEKKNKEFKVNDESIDNLIDKAIQASIIIKAGPWYKYNNKVLAQGKIKTINYLKENIDIYKEIEEKINSALK